MRRSHLQPGRRPKTLKLAPHTQRFRALRLADIARDALAQVREAREGLADPEPLEMAA